MVYRRAGHRCEACDATKNTDAGVYLEAHERWDYTTHDTQNVPTLKRLVCLCTPCNRFPEEHFKRLGVTMANTNTPLRVRVGPQPR